MVFGASGGIGHMAVQLAKRMGARVLAVASGQDGVEFAKRSGADKAVNGHKEDVAEAADFPVYASGGLGTIGDLRALADRGVAAAVIGMALYTGAMDPWGVAEEFSE